MTSKLHLFSQFVTDIHRASLEPEANVARFGLERLKSMLGFDCAWYGWARQTGDNTTVHASSTINLPDSFASIWSTMRSQDLVARALRQDRGRIGLYDRGQSAQTDGMIDFTERYSLRKIACAMHNRPNRSTTFFASVYRTDSRSRQWAREDLDLLQCGVDQIFLTMQRSFGRESAESGERWATLMVDPAGVAHLGLDNSRGMLGAIWPGWKGEKLPRALLRVSRMPGAHMLKREGVVVFCERDRGAGAQSELIRLRLSRLSRVDRLSPRERQVARLLAAGATHKNAAQALGSAPATIRNQTQAIYEKLGVRSRAQLAGIMLREGG